MPRSKKNNKNKSGWQGSVGSVPYFREQRNQSVPSGVPGVPFRIRQPDVNPQSLHLSTSNERFNASFGFQRTVGGAQSAPFDLSQKGDSISRHGNSGAFAMHQRISGCEDEVVSRLRTIPTSTSLSLPLDLTQTESRANSRYEYLSRFDVQPAGRHSPLLRNFKEFGNSDYFNPLTTKRQLPPAQMERAAAPRYEADSKVETMSAGSIPAAHMHSPLSYGSSQTAVRDTPTHTESRAYFKYEDVSRFEVQPAGRHSPLLCDCKEFGNNDYFNPLSMRRQVPPLQMERAAAPRYEADSKDKTHVSVKTLPAAHRCSPLSLGSSQTSSTQSSQRQLLVHSCDSDKVEGPEIAAVEAVDSASSPDSVHLEEQVSDATDGEEVQDDKPPVKLMLGSSKNCGAIYRPGINKPNDVDEEPQQETASKTVKTRASSTSRRGGKRAAKITAETETKSKTGTKPKTERKPKQTVATKSSKPPVGKESTKAALAKLREKAQQFYSSKGEKNANGKEQPKKVQTERRPINEGKTMTLNDFADDDDVSLRISRRLAKAYMRASSAQDAEDEMTYLRNAGALLPNGFKPLEPLFSVEGEMLLDIFGRESPALEEPKDGNEDLLEKKSSNERPECPICLKLVKRPYKCDKCEHLFCWVCFDEWLKNSSTCPLCRDVKDVITVPDEKEGDNEDEEDDAI